MLTSFTESFRVVNGQIKASAADVVCYLLCINEHACVSCDAVKLKNCINKSTLMNSFAFLIVNH